MDIDFDVHFLYIYIIHFSLLLPLVPQKDNN